MTQQEIEIVSASPPITTSWSSVDENESTECASYVHQDQDNALEIFDPSYQDSWIRAAIPHLPCRLALFYLLLNIGLPGSGTILSGWSTLCVGRCRMRNQTLVVIINSCVGVAQFLTIPWMLVGWLWSIAWGVILWFLSEDIDDVDVSKSNSLSDSGTLNSSSWSEQIPDEVRDSKTDASFKTSFNSPTPVSEWDKSTVQIT